MEVKHLVVLVILWYVNPKHIWLCSVTVHIKGLTIKIINKNYSYDITEQSTCLSNVPEEFRCNVLRIRDSRRIREIFLEGASRAD